jgi:zinc and cadmium transporter
MVDVLALSVWALVTGGTPLVLATVPYLRSRIPDRTAHLMLGLSAGILLGLSLLHIVPEAFEVAAGSVPALPPQGVPAGIALGFFALLLVERELIHRIRGHPIDHGHVHFEDGRAIQPFGTLALGALTIHGLVDGFVIPLGFDIDPTVGTVIGLAVAIHQIPDSFAALAIGFASTADRRKAAVFVLATAVDTPLGILVGVLFLGMGTPLIALGLAFSAGSFLFVSAADLIPELQHRARSALVTASIVVGFLLVAALAFLPGG